MTDPDFGRGDGDPLGGPTLPVADEPFPLRFDQVKLEFRVQRPNWHVQTVVCNFMDPSDEVEAHLLALWRIYHGEAVARAKASGGGDMWMA